MPVVEYAIKLLQRIANTSKDVDASTDDLNLHGARAQNAFCNIFFNKYNVLVELSHTFLLKRVATFSNSVDDGFCDAKTSLQGYVAHCESTERENLDRLAGQGGAQGGLGGSQGKPSAQGGPPTGSVDPDSRS